jgi:alpha-beta hydrolase superfamily lysophospholipase
VVSAYIKDPLIFNDMSFGLFTAIHDAGRWAVDYARDFPLPLLIMHGDADPVTSPAASRELAGRVPVECTLKIWKGLFHELHNEPQKQEIIAYVKGWLGRHL